MSNGVTIKVDLQTGGAAFATQDMSEALADILRDVADRVGNGQAEGRITDYNGGNVGSFSVTSEPETCIYCAKDVRFHPLYHDQVTDSAGLVGCGDAPLRSHSVREQAEQG